LNRPPTYVAALALVAALGLLAAAPVPADAQLVTRFDLSESVFSPDGNGTQDSTVASFTLSEDSPAISVVVFESDSTTVVDTLVATGPRTAGTHRVTWSGTYAGGGPVPEGLYLVTLVAQGTVEPDTSITLPVAVDITPPTLQILLSEPGIYAPGLDGTPQVYGATFAVTNASPTYGFPTLADELTLEITDPNGAAVPLDTFVAVVPPFAGQDGTYELRWDANSMQTVVDGHYLFELTLTDKAGHSAFASDQSDVDVELPKVTFLNVADGASFATVPDSLYGWAWDRSGIDSLFVKYSSESPYTFVTDATVINDTTFFGVPLADSLSQEGTYTIRARAKDAVAANIGWVSTPSIRVTVDRSAPPAPTLEPFDGEWRSPTFVLRGTWSDNPRLVRVFRNGAQVDSVFTLLVQTLEREVALVPGLNVFTATAVDGADNVSPPSNEVRVTFEDETGLFIPVPFHPNDVFGLNLAEAAAEATLRIFDMTGELVVKLEHNFAARNYVFHWDGLNGDGIDVKRGPLVAVADAENPDGTTVIMREIFLFAPDQ